MLVPVRRVYVLLQERRDGGLEAAVVGTVRTVVESPVGELALRPPEAFKRLREEDVRFMAHNRDVTPFFAAIDALLVYHSHLCEVYRHYQLLY